MVDEELEIVSGTSIGTSKLLTRLVPDTNLVESITIGEDWVGVFNMVEQSNMQYKDEVLEIINTVPVMRGREKRLMDLKWGHPYNYMMDHFFPKLRNAGYIRIFYETKPDVEFENTNQAIELYIKRRIAMHSQYLKVLRQRLPPRTFAECAT